MEKETISKLNIYWTLSWWYIYDWLDRICHKEAISLIGDCVTIDWHIKYLWEITRDDLELTQWQAFIAWNNKVVINTTTENKVFATFTFLKKK